MQHSYEAYFVMVTSTYLRLSPGMSAVPIPCSARTATADKPLQHPPRTSQTNCPSQQEYWERIWIFDSIMTKSSRIETELKGYEVFELPFTWEQWVQFLYCTSWRPLKQYASCPALTCLPFLLASCNLPLPLIRLATVCQVWHAIFYPGGRSICSSNEVRPFHPSGYKLFTSHTHRELVHAYRIHIAQPTPVATTINCLTVRNVSWDNHKSSQREGTK